MAWTLRISETARRQLKKLGWSTALGLLRCVNLLLMQTENPPQRGKALTGNLSGLWRYRVGDDQVICQIDAEQLVMLMVGLSHCGDALA